MNKNPLLQNRSLLLFWGSVGIFFTGMLYLVHRILMPFLAAILIAYILNPLVKKLETYHVPRWLGCGGVIFGFFSVLVLLVLIAFPFLRAELLFFITHFPEYGEKFLNFIQPVLEKATDYASVEEIHRLRDLAAGSARDLFSWGIRFIMAILTSGMALANLLSLLVISPVVAFYILNDWGAFLSTLDRLIPLPARPSVRKLFREIDKTLGGYARGQLIVCGILALYYSLGLFFLGMNFSLVVGALTGILAFIPYIGFLGGLMMALLVSFSQFSAGDPLWMVCFLYVGGSLLEGMILTPKFLGSRTGLHPAWIIFSLFAGGSILDFTGVLLAFPLAATLGVCVRFSIQAYWKSPFYDPRILPNQEMD